MNLIYFPTRFYPAISGGDFYIQRLGEELQKNRQLNILGSQVMTADSSDLTSEKPNHIQKNQVSILTTDAIDFASVHGRDGRYLQPTAKFYTTYRGLNLHRFHVLQTAPDLSEQELIQGKEWQGLSTLSQKQLAMNEKSIKFFIQNGPILPAITDYLLDKRTNENENLFQLGNALQNNPTSPAILHCSYLPYANLIYTLLLGKKWGHPTAVTPFLHDQNERYQMDFIIDVLKHFDVIFACTQHEKKIIEDNGIPPPKIHVLPMGVDAKKFAKDTTKPRLNQLPISKPLVLFCGYKNHEKGALTILNAIPAIMQKNPLTTIMFIGPSTKAFNYTFDDIKHRCPTANIINLTPDNLAGIFDPQKIAAFQQADIYCMPSNSDAYGIAYLEAWASKVPVIAANTPAMAEVIHVNEDGMLVPFDNSQALADAIGYLLANPVKAKTMGEKGYEKVIANNQWGDIARKTLQIYQKVCQDFTNQSTL